MCSSDLEGIRARAAAELAQCGRFERVFPTPDSAACLSLFPVPRYGDLVLAAGPQPWHDRRLQPTATLTTTGGGSLLTAAGGQRSVALNPSAAYIWLAAQGGATPAAIAADLQRAFPTAGRSFEHDARGLLADWTYDGYLREIGRAHV